VHAGQGGRLGDGNVIGQAHAASVARVF
jgi:hypothetical protein